MVVAWLDTVIANSIIVKVVEDPSIFNSMIWAMVPMILTLILMEFYFSHHPSEELGWNTAFGNSLMIIFVSLGLFGRLIEQNQIAINFSSIMTLLLFLFGVLLTVIDFFKLVPKNLAFGVSSALTVNMFGVISILAVYTQMTFSLANMLVILAIVLVIISIIKLIELFYLINYFESKEDVEQNEYYKKICLDYIKKGYSYPQIRDSLRQSELKDPRITFIFESALSQFYSETQRSYQDYLFSRYAYQ